MKQIIKISDVISFGDNLTEIADRYNQYPNAVIEVNVENYGDDIDLRIEYEREETDAELTSRENKEKAKVASKAKRAETVLAKRIVDAADRRDPIPERVLRKTCMDWIRSKDHRIFSTATLSGNIHRISIPWDECKKYSSLKSALRQCVSAERRAKELVAEMEHDFPILKGLIAIKFHVGACLYLSLRISPRKG